MNGKVWKVLKPKHREQSERLGHGRLHIYQVWGKCDLCASIHVNGTCKCKMMCASNGIKYGWIEIQDQKGKYMESAGYARNSMRKQVYGSLNKYTRLINLDRKCIEILVGPKQKGPISGTFLLGDRAFLLWTDDSTGHRHGKVAMCPAMVMVSWYGHGL